MLTSKTISSLKPKKTRYQINDSTGLVIRIQTTGVQSWVLRAPQNGRTKDITLGNLPEIPLSQARALARRKKNDYELNKPGS